MEKNGKCVNSKELIKTLRDMKNSIDKEMLANRGEIRLNLALSLSNGMKTLIMQIKEASK